MSEEIRRVVVVRRPKLTPAQIRAEKKEQRADMRYAAKIEKQLGREYFVFYWPAERFAAFATKCREASIKPNDYLWGLIQKDMGWTD